MYLKQAPLDYLLGFTEPGGGVSPGGQSYLFLKQLVTNSPLDR